ncbi:MAG: helix-turn-helix transcriptional regulator [Armatimonadetes bacterium]|nr:helix-turn-helix transcriptional regulator [Armatimonadota bacterium]
MTGQPPINQRFLYLTPREKDILNLVQEGKTARTTAEILDISKRTVEYHLLNVYQKLRVRSKEEAVQRAIELGLLEPLNK